MQISILKEDIANYVLSGAPSFPLCFCFHNIYLKLEVVITLLEFLNSLFAFIQEIDFLLFDPYARWCLHAAT